MAGGDAGAAVGDQAFHRPLAEEGGEALAQGLGGEEAAVGAEVVGEHRALGAGDMAGHRVDGLHLAPEAGQGAGIEQCQVVSAQAALQFVGAAQQLGRLRR